MKLVVILPVILVVIFSACKKEHNETQESACPVNTIFYKNNKPDTTVNSSYYLDVNNDSINDICFQSGGFMEFCYTTQVYITYFYATGSDSIEFIHKGNGYPYQDCILPISSGMYIGFHDKTDTLIRLQYHDPCPGFGCNSFREKNYIGFILHKNGVKYLGWVHLRLEEYAPFLIYEYATLSTQCDSIKVGLH
jgi:hypothetical protein